MRARTAQYQKKTSLINIGVVSGELNCFCLAADTLGVLPPSCNTLLGIDWLHRSCKKYFIWHCLLPATLGIELTLFIGTHAEPLYIYNIYVGIIVGRRCWLSDKLCFHARRKGCSMRDGTFFFLVWAGRPSGGEGVFGSLRSPGVSRQAGWP